MKNSENSLFGYNSEDIRTGQVQLPGAEKPAGRKPGKGVYIAVVAALSVLLSVLLIWVAVDRVNEGLVMELEVGDITPYTLEDGRYSGTFSSGDLGAAVTITVESGFITDIALDAFTGIDTARAQRVFQAVIFSQSLVTYDDEVGSTPTDVILLCAIREAVEGSSGVGDV